MPAGNPTAATVFRELDPKQSCRAATTVALPANTRSGNVLTADANGALPAIDGVALVANDRFLVQDEAAGANNGIYDVTDLGSGSTKWVLTRSADFDQDSEVTSGARTFVSEGTANVGRKFTLVTADPITLNTTSLTFDQTGGPGGDTDAIHVNVAAEISGITEKVTVVGDDLVAIEDSEDGNKKARAKISSLGSGLHPVVDTQALVKGSGDPTKLFRIEADPNIPTSSTVAMTVPAANFEPDDKSAERDPTAHAAEHTDGTDDIQNATAAQKGLATAAQITKLNGIATGAVAEGATGDTHAAIVVGNPHDLDAADVGAAPSSHVGAGGAAHADVVAAGDDGFMTGADKTKLDGIETAATADQTNAEIESAYNAQVAVVTQPEAEAGTETAVRRWTPERVKQAIVALGVPLDSFELDADQFEIPVSGDRPASIVSLAPTVADSVNAGLAVLRFDDTDEEARQFSRRIKAGALTMKLKLLWRAQTAPGDALHDIGWKLYWREIPDGGAAPSATWAGTNDGSQVLTEIVDIADDVFFHEVEETLTLASLTQPILLDREYQFLLSRIAPAGTNLVGDWVVRRLAVEID